MEHRHVACAVKTVSCWASSGRFITVCRGCGGSDRSFMLSTSALLTAAQTAESLFRDVAHNTEQKWSMQFSGQVAHLKALRSRVSAS
jgi:hypothetical protein